MVQGGKDGRAVQTMLKAADVEEILRRAGRMLADEFHARFAGLAYLSGHWNTFDGAATGRPASQQPEDVLAWALAAYRGPLEPGDVNPFREPVPELRAACEAWRAYRAERRLEPWTGSTWDESFRALVYQRRIARAAAFSVRKAALSWIEDEAEAKRYTPAQTAKDRAGGNGRA